MRALMKSLGCLLAATLLASCGGGGGSGNNTAFEPSGYHNSITPSSISTTPGSVVPFSVTVTSGNGQPISNGQLVSVTVTPAGIGLLSTTHGATVLSEAVSDGLIGGVANFRFHARSIGTGTITASTVDTATGRTISGTATVTVSAGPSSDNRLTLQLGNSTIPKSPHIGLDTVFPGSPYTTQVTVTQRHLDGTAVNSGSTAAGGDQFCDAGTGGGAAIGNGNSAALWLPAEGIDDSTTPPTIKLCRSITYGFNSGVAIFYLVSFTTVGQTTVTVSATDPDTGEVLSASAVINVTDGSPNLPGSVIITDDSSPVYVTGTNGAQSKRFQTFVYDGATALITDAPAGVDNVTLEIVGGAQGGERLQGVNAAGQTVTGSSINVRTFNGIANFSYQSGTRQGVVTLRATADRADNNVSNGTTDPVTSTRGFAVSDGKLFDLVLTHPLVNAVFVNGTGDSVDVTGPGGATVTIPLQPDGTYSLTVSALCTDRFGNPCVAGTEIKFGMIDYPKIPAGGAFAITGNDGDPQESGTLFTAPTGLFTTAGGGAGPGDTLIVFGRIPEAPAGNRDLESARTVQSVNSATSLNVTYRFNPNDDTGASVNNGPVLPYVIGRATSGNVTNSALTNSVGVATGQLTYTVGKVGTLAVLWAQGSGVIVGGQAKLVTDAQYIRFPGIAPGTLTATPTTIPGNTTAAVLVCLRDALGSGISEFPIGFFFNNIGGTGSVNGVQTSGTFSPLTDSSGCVIANVTTAGVTQPSGTGTNNNPPQVVFTAAGLTATVDIVTSGQILQATPSNAIGAGLWQIRLKLIEANGTPINGVQLSVTCQASGGGALSVVRQPGVTGQPQSGVSPQNGPGQTTSDIDAVNFNQCGATASGTCVFTTPTGSPSTTVTFTGIDLSTVNVSPPCP